MTQPTIRALTGHRQESWRVDVLDASEALLGEVRVTAGEITASIHDTIRSSATIELAEPLPIDWRVARLRPVHRIVTAEGEYEERRGVFIPTTPLTTYGDGVQDLKYGAYDKTVLLEQDATAETWGFDRGANIIAAVIGTIESTGETSIRIDPQPLTLTAALEWEAGTTKLRIVNDLLEAANHFAIWTDGSGAYRSTPYQDPKTRGVAWDFSDHPETSIIAPGLTHEVDGFDVPNRVVLVGRSPDEETPPEVAVAQNENPASPWSYQARGRWITHTETGVEAADDSGETLDGLAARRLIDLTQAGATIGIDHALIPLDLNAVCTVRLDGRLDALAVLQSQRITMATGALVQSTLREVAA